MADKNNATISLCVDKVLDHVGASEQIRKNHVEKGMVDEIVTNLTYPILYNENVRWHNFGSWAEGTTTKGLKSDIDRLFYGTNLPAVEQIPDGFENGLLIINDGTTKPGYVKLQLVYNGIPISNIATPDTDTDQFGRVCEYSGSRMIELDNTLIPHIREERIGPAITVYGSTKAPDVDNVYAYRCYTVPSFTSGWIHRPRKYDWPSKQQLDKMCTYGCFLVHKGHPTSQAPNLEWRISFSFQERELMFSLNSTQHKCYILLKMIKQDLIQKTKVKSISSYHLKTSLFYTIENIPTHIWIPDNIVKCTELCLKQLLDWLNNKNCPNFFVPEENMFDRPSSDVMKMAATLIRDMLDSDRQYLVLLTCDKFGELLQDSLSGKVLPNLGRDAIEFDLHSRMCLLTVSMGGAKKIVISTNSKCAAKTLTALQFLLEQLRKEEERLTSEKLFREIKQGSNLILPTIHLQIAQTLAAIMLTVTDEDKKRELMLEYDHHVEQTKDIDRMSQRLIQASLLYKENKLEECERILADCETALKYCNLNACSCTDSCWGNEIEHSLEKGDTTSLSLLELRKYVASCLVFLPSQADLVPLPLHYEMYRSVGADTNTINPDLDSWYGVMGIDANVYVFFLQNLVYSKLNKHEIAAGVKSKLDSFLLEAIEVSKVNERLIIGHIETGLNLFGWILKQENDIEFATKCFYESWKKRPDHNAAKWHMLVMMYEQYVHRSRKMRNS